jgi:hypothetical protein
MNLHGTCFCPAQALFQRQQQQQQQYQYQMYLINMQELHQLWVKGFA